MSIDACLTFDVDAETPILSVSGLYARNAGLMSHQDRGESLPRQLIHSRVAGRSQDGAGCCRHENARRGAGSSSSLEQIGTAADCTRSSAVYSVWYELVPSAPVTVKRIVRAGDTISATVKVAGTTVSLRLTDVTRGWTFAKELTMSSPDVSSAEWIAEAPSACDGRGTCVPLSLTDFGTVAFSKATATAKGHTGTIADSAWSATAIDLQGGGAGGFGPFAAVGIVADALPSALSSGGSSFSVRWTQGAPSGPGV